MLKAFVLASAVLALAAASTGAGAANGYRVLYTFQGAADGGEPGGSLVRDAAGNFYGTTRSGGDGAVFALSPQGVKTTLHAFLQSDGVVPQGPLLLDAQGALFGTAETGGPAGCNGVGCGTAFEIAPGGSETTLHAFKAAQSSFPAGGLVADAAGNLTGTLNQNGPAGTGAIFKLSPQGRYTLLHGFDYDTEGGYPEFGLVADRQGNLYGTTTLGGPMGSGAIFRYAPDGTLTVLHNFSSADGSIPGGRLALDRRGNLYGVLGLGGPAGKGSVFRLARDGGFTTLYAFTGGADGSLPVSMPVLDGKGDIYGTTRSGSGAVYKLATDGTLSVLHAFDGDAGYASGYYPMGELLLDHRHLYGATMSGGVVGGECADGCGVIYQINLK